MIGLPTSEWITADDVGEREEYKKINVQVRHVFTHFKLSLDLYTKEIDDLEKIDLSENQFIASAEEGLKLGLPTVFKKAYKNKI